MIIVDNLQTTNGMYYHAHSDAGRYVMVDGKAYGHYWGKEMKDFTEGDPIPTEIGESD